MLSMGTLWFMCETLVVSGCVEPQGSQTFSATLLHSPDSTSQEIIRCSRTVIISQLTTTVHRARPSLFSALPAAFQSVFLFLVSMSHLIHAQVRAVHCGRSSDRIIVAYSCGSLLWMSSFLNARLLLHSK